MLAFGTSVFTSKKLCLLPALSSSQALLHRRTSLSRHCLRRTLLMKKILHFHCQTGWSAAPYFAFEFFRLPFEKPVKTSKFSEAVWGLNGTVASAGSLKVVYYLRLNQWCLASILPQSRRFCFLSVALKLFWNLPKMRPDLYQIFQKTWVSSVLSRYSRPLHKPHWHFLTF